MCDPSRGSAIAPVRTCPTSLSEVCWCRSLRRRSALTRAAEAPARTVRSLLRQAEDALAAGVGYVSTPMPIGFRALDQHLGGGLRAGELTLLAGVPGLGKTVFALQAARNVAVAGGHAVYVCYEHGEQQLLERLIAMEAGLLADYDGVSLNEVRAALQAGAGATDLMERHPSEIWRAAIDAVASYGDRLQLVCGSARHNGLPRLQQLAEHRSSGQRLLVVDYLQKVPSPVPVTTEDDRATVVVEALKDMALEQGVAVLAIVAADKKGFEGRTTVNHLRGSTALAYEADVVLVLNDKYSIVARHHLMYGSVGTERFHDYVVCTIEKNRAGVDGVDLEFRKHFDQARFDPTGGLVAETLVDDRIHVE